VLHDYWSWLHDGIKSDLFDPEGRFSVPRNGRDLRLVSPAAGLGVRLC